MKFSCKLCKYQTNWRKEIRNHLKVVHGKKSMKTRGVIKSQIQFHDYYEVNE